MPAQSERHVAGVEGFPVTLRGYRATEVDQALAKLRDQVDSLAADRDRLTEEKNQLASRLLVAIRRSNELDTRVKHLSASAESADGLSERIRVILELASAEANSITTKARELLEQARAAQTELDRRRAELEAEEQQVLAAARAEAEELREQARKAASAGRAEAQAEVERIVDDAKASAKAVVDEGEQTAAAVVDQARQAAATVVDDARRTAAADIDRVREHLQVELPRRLGAVLDDATGFLPRAEMPGEGDPGKPVPVPRPRQP
jgi:DivIVA domain-containing protein